MRYMIMFRGETDEETTAPVCKDSDSMRELIGELKSAGVLHSTEGLRPSARGARVRLSGGKVAVTDGPFAEAKELIAGYVIVEAASKEAAVQLSERFLRRAPEGSSAEVREILESPVASFGEISALTA